ncbi:hypothetical protein BGZ61DRAFT_590960 [Ilyonectria robusta]|uniref:uncharacterized protein n=1 Tax=Ilyonectria robusta TaxID=1079257 RepID=UPI001E8DD352|nr:uncharacterized protein BGZ61DRAFT_590960 [Ilyonectria robusta]KAH8679489.1 hypothetical protein BGZ61DRAFT_590960 [Ilyonectria robusta]
MKEKITELYYDNGYQLRLVKDIMWSIYQFGEQDRNAYNRRFKKWGISKNKNTVGSQDRTRARAVHKAPHQRVQELVLAADEFDMHMHMTIEVPETLQFKQFEHHEVVLKSVDDFIYGVFDSGKEGWSADVTSFIDPDRKRCSATYHWRVLSDRCHSVALLIRANLHSKAEMTLENLFQNLATVDNYRHPAFMVEFWRLCIRIQGIDCHIPRANAMSRLFRVIKITQQVGSPVHRLISSLSSVDAKDLRNVLRIGYVKAIRTFSVLIGDENVMILDMLSFYCKFFTTAFLTRQTLIAKFDYVWHQTYELRLNNSTARVAIDYAFAYAAYYVIDAPYLAIGMAQTLRDTIANGPCLIGRLEWTLETEAFSFSSKIVAELHRQRANRAENWQAASGDYSRCCASMQGAITKLEHGDRDCRTRAAMLSKVLNRWLVEWELQKEADEEALRTRRIEDSILGKPCTRCVRNQYCTKCACALENGKLRDEGCNRCKEHKLSRMCQKCAARQKNIGWKPSDKWLQVRGRVRPS